MSLEEYAHYWTPIPPKRSDLDRRYQKHVRTNLNSSHGKDGGKIPEVWFEGETIPRSDYKCQMGRAVLGQHCCLELRQDSCKEPATGS